jgi:hypothetical protein
VRVAIEDRRSDTNVLTPQAAEVFSAFADRYSLAWVLPNNERVLAGEHDLLDALRESFKKRLTQMGATVTLRAQNDIAQLTVAVTQLKVDLQNRKWLIDLSYEATLSRNAQPRIRETVRGSAERVQLLGRKGADMALSEIFSDVTNRLDLVKLFKQAKLLP